MAETRQAFPIHYSHRGAEILPISDISSLLKSVFNFTLRKTHLGAKLGDGFFDLYVSCHLPSRYIELLNTCATDHPALTRSTTDQALTGSVLSTPPLDTS